MNRSRHRRALASWCLIGFATALLGCETLIGLEERQRRHEDAGDDDSDRDAGRDPPSADAGQTPTESNQCSLYCDRVLDACTDEDGYSQYYQQNRVACLNVCELLREAQTPGDAGAGDAASPMLSGDNTITCRAKEALNASQIEPDVQCPLAGPGGDDTCGDNCESYCYLYSRACADFPEFLVDDCVNKCRALRDLSAERREPGESSLDATRDHEGDTLQCRLVHVSSATVSPQSHCWHAQLAPRSFGDMQNPCAAYPDETEPRCEDYCRILMRACDSFELAPYESTAQCLKVCAEFEPGSVMDSGGKPVLEDNNTLGCRKAHAYNALLATPNIHCRHSGPGGAGVCGNNCASYCGLLQAACSSEFQAEFGAGATGLTGCEESCQAIRGDEYRDYSVNRGETGDPADAFACRLLAVSRALEDPADAALCESALGRGDCAP